MTRLETFTDAAFAFAVTLLVVGGGDAVPVDFSEMLSALKQVPAFAASFANIMVFWYAHHVWSRRFGLEDARSVILSMLLIFLVLIFVYPLKAIYSGAIEFFSFGYFESYFGLYSIMDLRSLFAIFGASYAALSGVVLMLNMHAYSLRTQLLLNELELFDLQTEKTEWLINTAVPAVSILLAATLPGGWVFMAGVFYSVLAVIFPWYSIRRSRQRAAIAGPTPP